MKLFRNCEKGLQLVRQLRKQLAIFPSQPIRPPEEELDGDEEQNGDGDAPNTPRPTRDNDNNNKRDDDALVIKSTEFIRARKSTPDALQGQQPQQQQQQQQQSQTAGQGHSTFEEAMAKELATPSKLHLAIRRTARHFAQALSASATDVVSPPPSPTAARTRTDSHQRAHSPEEKAPPQTTPAATNSSSLHPNFASPSRVPPALLSRPELEHEVKHQRQAIKALLQFKKLVENGSVDGPVDADTAAAARDGPFAMSATSSSLDGGSGNVQGVQERLSQLRAANQKEMALQAAQARVAALEHEHRQMQAELQSRAGAVAGLQATKDALAAQVNGLRDEVDITSAAATAAAQARRDAESNLRAAKEQAERERESSENTIATLRMALGNLEQTETRQHDHLDNLETVVTEEQQACEQLTARLHDQTERATEHAAAVRRK